MSYLPELRASLVRAAERQHRPARSTHRSGSLAIVTAVGVAIAVIALAIVLVGHRGGGPSSGHGGPAGGSGGQAPPSVPNLSAAQEKLIQQARNATTSHDPACRPFRTLPPFAAGSPGPPLSAILGVLRRPAAAIDKIPPQFLPQGPPPLGVYRSAIRRARDRDGTSLYIVPTMGLGFRPVPGRCAGEERAALASAIKGRPAREVSMALSGQARYLAWQQYEARHPQAICLAEIDHKPAGSRIGGAGGLACGWDVAMIEQGLAGLGTEDSAASPPLFHGIVPDGVARVRLELPAHAGVRTAMPVNNVYLARLPRGVNAPARVVWQAADGSVIRTTRVP